MRLAAWCWAFPFVLFVGCGDDAKEKAPGGSSGDAGSGAGEVGGESAGGSGSGATSPGASGSGTPDPGAGGPGSEAGAGVGGAAVEAPLGTYASGTRLSAISWSAGSDAKQWLGWYDSELDLGCGFRLGEDGKLRCMPETYVNGYADADCTVPVVVAQPGCGAPPFVSEGNGVCGDELTGYEVAEPIATPATTYIYSGSTCQEAVFGGNGQFYAVEKVAPTTFVAAEERLNLRDDAVAMTYLQAEDGALQSVLPYDVGRGHDCRPLLSGPFAGRCVPNYVGYVSTSIKFFSDESCTNRIAHDPSCREAPLDAIAILTVAECNGQVEFNYNEAGEPAEALSQETNNQCSAPNWLIRYYEIGDPIPATGVPELPTTDLGAGRIKARYFADANGAPLTFATFYDSELDTDCVARPTTDGNRCLPPASFLSQFVDDTCTTLLVTVGQPAQGCQEAEPPLYSHTQADVPIDQCGGELALRVFKTGNKIAKPNVLYMWSGGQCQATGGQVGDHIFYGATEVPITDFAELNRELE